MAADLTQPFKESCCDGGACSGVTSTQPCGCDPGANYPCKDYPSCAWGKWEADDTVASIARSLDVTPESLMEYAIESVVGIQATEDAMRDTVPAMSVGKTGCGWDFAVAPSKRTGTTIAEVKTFRGEMHTKSMAMIDKKGADYNRDQQEAGDTLFNLRVCEILGVVPSAEEGILVRLSDKLMRLISLTKPGRDAAVKDESVLDTIADIHNYVDYLGLIWQQRRTK